MLEFLQLFCFTNLKASVLPTIFYTHSNPTTPENYSYLSYNDNLQLVRKMISERTFHKEIGNVEYKRIGKSPNAADPELKTFLYSKKLKFRCTEDKL